ncbi:hypothetical protein CA13_11260 [Planctomycetes bacterium CA13]|uniref:Uncharacterized protein n=1 Tax=Novipirellula herctigrandis TaxID=2527986 RepID=A0A5C5YXD0_9BACT|nr:hypothetical protein CA13_11260 [Planctomycetes bacterium CA13]
MAALPYVDPKDGNPTSGTIKLRHERDGRYRGVIRNEPFLKMEPDENGERGLIITVVDASLGFEPRPNEPEIKGDEGLL